MHIFDYSFLKDDLLPAQLVNYAANTGVNCENRIGEGIQRN